ncbi:type 1 periplasmic binding fold superfamily protein [Tenacibaculum sp. SG-28]|uniref:type 1 periplasmic binding fold superfamily protein n=1 Tax=Tenacibaculum sp. SG-28 TaxID=754426 RepID=UPI000CF4EB05|nr:type 1 periplasmic binding fold superfamily protein [Tenacibaculum sp. SG-28]PQJ23214.1 type 1 periplasmic binding fold superfamily protein [Tenacibaculum sp. SG-28]
MKQIKLLSFLFIATLVLSSCSDDPEPINDEEVITSMTVSLLADNGSTVVMQTLDADGDGPLPAVVETIGNFTPNTTYTGSIVLLNTLENPAEVISEEVKEEDDEHQFFFQHGNDIETAYEDFDANGNPLGLSFTLTTNAAGTGTLTVTLRHEPNKDAAGVSDGDITNAGGSTDIETTFTYTVE